MLLSLPNPKPNLIKPKTFQGLLDDEAEGRLIKKFSNLKTERMLSSILSTGAGHSPYQGIFIS